MQEVGGRDGVHMCVRALQVAAALATNHELGTFGGLAGFVCTYTRDTALCHARLIQFTLSLGGVR